MCLPISALSQASHDRSSMLSQKKTQEKLNNHYYLLLCSSSLRAPLLLTSSLYIRRPTFPTTTRGSSTVSRGHVVREICVSALHQVVCKRKKSKQTRASRSCRCREFEGDEVLKPPEFLKTASGLQHPKLCDTAQTSTVYAMYSALVRHGRLRPSSTDR